MRDVYGADGVDIELGLVPYDADLVPIAGDGRRAGDQPRERERAICDAWGRGLIIEGEAPYAITSYTHPCAGSPWFEGDYNDGTICVPGQGLYEEGGSYGNAMGADGSGTDAMLVADGFLAMTAKAFTVAQIERLPAGATITKAILRVKTGDLVETKYNTVGTVVGEPDKVTYVLTKTENAVDAPVTLALLGEDVNGTITLLAIGETASASNNNDEWFDLDVTTLCQAYQAARSGSYIRFAVTIHPEAGTAVFAQKAGKAIVAGILAASYDCTVAHYTDPDNPAYGFRYCAAAETRKITWTDWTMGALYLTFALPNMKQYRAPVCNIPGMS